MKYGVNTAVYEQQQQSLPTEPLSLSQPSISSIVQIEQQHNEPITSFVACQTTQQQYEGMADKAKDDPLLKYDAKDYWLKATICALYIDAATAGIVLNHYVHDNPLFEERSLEVKSLRQLIAAAKEQNRELFSKHIDDTPLSTLRDDRVFCSSAEDIGKKIHGDVDPK